MHKYNPAEKESLCANRAEQTSSALWRFKKVQEYTGLSRSTIYSYISCGQFPAPIKVGVRAVAWPSSEIEAFVGQKIAASRQTT